MRKVTIFCSASNSVNYDEAGIFELDQAGVARLTIVNPLYVATLHNMEAGVAPRSAMRVIEPEEGELFLMGLCEDFANTSYIAVVPDSSGA